MPGSSVSFPERAQLAIDLSGLHGGQLHTAMTAAGCKISLNHCYRLMRGEIDNPRFDTIAALIIATGVPATWFFDRDVDATPETLNLYMARGGGRASRSS